MTSKKGMAILVAVTIVMVLITVVLYSNKGAGRQTFESGSLLIQGLEPEKVHTISITKGSDKVTLVRKEKGFLLAERQDYPASINKVNELLLACLEARCKSKVTDSKSNHKELGVAEGADDATTVTFKDSAGKTLIGLALGKSGESGRPYIRLLDSDTVYAAENYLTINSTPTYYLEKKLVEVKNDDVRRVEVKSGADSYAITRDDKGTISLDKVPEGKRAKDTMRDTVLYALSNLDFTDVTPVDKSDLTWDTTYTCRLASDLVYTVMLAKKGEKHFIKVSASAPNIDSVSVAPNESDAALKKKDALLQAVEKSREFTRQHAGWVYEVQPWAAEKMRRPLSELVEDIPKDTTPEEISASHILIAYRGAERSEATRTKDEAKKRADEVLVKVKAEGADFTALAKEYSDEPGAREKGGDLGAFKKGAMAKPFEEAAFKLKVGDISDVVETQFGFHVIKRTK
jgi:parvulin-like peptidyl-prolyl isomerase